MFRSLVTCVCVCVCVVQWMRCSPPSLTAPHCIPTSVGLAVSVHFAPLCVGLSVKVVRFVVHMPVEAYVCVKVVVVTV
ncbi:MAG: hypothetical protein P4L40_22595 [Terracidiphilus sp.]|nr:hypothetical protein [Terracidiphilus sp.]